MTKREKKRDKFSIKMLKGVKNLWEVLKPEERLLSPKAESGDEVLVA